jgi:hypothetical protein
MKFLKLLNCLILITLTTSCGGNGSDKSMDWYFNAKFVKSTKSMELLKQEIRQTFDFKGGEFLFRVEDLKQINSEDNPSETIGTLYLLSGTTNGMWANVLVSESRRMKYYQISFGSEVYLYTPIQDDRANEFGIQLNHPWVIKDKGIVAIQSANNIWGGNRDDNIELFTNFPTGE